MQSANSVVPLGHAARIGDLAQIWKGCGIALTDPVVTFRRQLDHIRYIRCTALLKARWRMSQAGWCL